MVFIGNNYEGKTDMTKTELLESLATGSDLTKKQVGQVIDVLGEVIGTQLGKKGSGTFILPGLLKITRVSKPARKAGKKPNPFKPGEMMVVKARAAHSVVKVRPLKKLKDMV
jgi:nucleoid DNA-binding protein